jgi:hypothetical protein
LTALGFAALGVAAATTLIREHDCQRELARRQADEGGALDVTAASCLAALGGRVLHDR